MGPSGRIFTTISLMEKNQGLSPGLKSIFKFAGAALGEVIAEEEGRRLFLSVESVRRQMVRFRVSGDEGKRRTLERTFRLLGRLSPKERAAFARAYTVYLELANACENAYRTHRLRLRHAHAKPVGGADIVYVLTAHPTESRSPGNIRLMRRVQDLLIGALEAGSPPAKQPLKHLLHLVWRAGTFPSHRPTVEDEARHVFSILSDLILEEILRLRREGRVVRLRTWVGGDKDGHPGVGPAQTRASLNLSRRRLLDFMNMRLLRPMGEDITLLRSAALSAAWARVGGILKGLSAVRPGDGGRIASFRRAMGRFNRLYRRRLGYPHPLGEQIIGFLELFPGMVVTLELREERGRFREGEAIAGMIRYLGSVARGGDIRWYVRGCVVSMTQSAEDLWQAMDLMRRVLGAPSIPVIPLFETPEVLSSAAGILELAFKNPAFRRAVYKHRGARMEVMLGYSDTAKRMGVFPGRLAIDDAMQSIARWGRRRGVTIIFFHGAGGSVGRGGGTVEEQAATWPADAVRLIKITLQGEMVERTLATPEILRSQILKMAAIQASPPAYRGAGAWNRRLNHLAHEAYKSLVESGELREAIRTATPYSRLGALQIGSRPSHRSARAGLESLESLRAIPWMLCWTQTRYLLPVWFGLGSAWRRLRREPRAEMHLARALKSDPALRSFFRQLGFTLTKVEPQLWRRYFQSLAPGFSPDWLRALERERRDALDLARRASPDGELLSDRPWLKESIFYRAPMIHPLNLLQIQVLARTDLSRQNELLFRETVTGIAAGMLTTG